MELRGKAALVTGASRGLGAALAHELSRRGARVVLTARGGAALETVVGAIRAAGGEAHGLVGDVADKQGVFPLVGAASALLGPLDLLVHNASTLGPLPMPELCETECEDFAAVLEANLLGPFRLTKAIVGSMLLRGQGLVLGISSDAGATAYPRWGAYGVSKAALDHLMRIWAAELGPAGVRFLSLDPGEMDTRMHAQAMPDADRSALRKPAQVAAWIAGIVAAAETFENGARLAIDSWAGAAA